MRATVDNLRSFFMRNLLSKVSGLVLRRSSKRWLSARGCRRDIGADREGGAVAVSMGRQSGCALGLDGEKEGGAWGVKQAGNLGHHRRKSHDVHLDERGGVGKTRLDLDRVDANV